MPKYIQCNCPKCSHSGVSIAAMHYKETQQWQKSGSFSGSGIGIGTGGIGVGVGGGTYSETGEIATKRANVFSEPTPYSVPILPLILPLVLILFTINSLPMMMDFLQSMAPNGRDNLNMEGIYPLISVFNKYVAPAYGVFIIFMILRNLFKAQKEENTLNTTVYPKQLERYNEIRYCENCHSLYDHNNNAENANHIGMEKLMSIPPGL